MSRRQEQLPLEAETTEEVESWRPIDGFPGYEVSDWGRVRSWYTRVYASGQCGARRGWVDTPVILKPGNRLGRPFVNLYHDTGKAKAFKVQHLVLTAFVGSRPSPKHVACHFPDPDTFNNRLDNLRWGTLSENSIDAVTSGRRIHCVLGAEDIPKIWERFLRGDTNSAIAKDFGVKRLVISGVRHGRTWRHITKSLPALPGSDDRRARRREPVRCPPEVCDSSEEMWRRIPNYEVYDVSSWGRVRSRHYRGARRLWTGPPKTRLLKAKGTGSNPYPRVALKNAAGVNFFLVSRLVMEAFAGPCPPGMECCHGDDDPMNNHARNLRWDTKAGQPDRHRESRPQKQTDRG